jgi:hypothetical protein
MSLLSRPIVYVQVSAGSLAAELVGEMQRTTVTCPALAHPRTLMGDFTAVEAAMREALEKIGLRKWYSRAPITLTHLLPKVDGGYTNVELRAFREAAIGAGAARSYLLADHPPLPTNDRAQFKQFFSKSFV